MWKENDGRWVDPKDKRREGRNRATAGKTKGLLKLKGLNANLSIITLHVKDSVSPFKDQSDDQSDFFTCQNRYCLQGTHINHEHMDRKRCITQTRTTRKTVCRPQQSLRCTQETTAALEGHGPAFRVNGPGARRLHRHCVKHPRALESKQ